MDKQIDWNESQASLGRTLEYISMCAAITSFITFFCVWKDTKTRNVSNLS